MAVFIFVLFAIFVCVCFIITTARFAVWVGKGIYGLAPLITVFVVLFIIIAVMSR